MSQKNILMGLHVFPIHVIIIMVIFNKFILFETIFEYVGWMREATESHNQL